MLLPHVGTSDLAPTETASGEFFLGISDDINLPSLKLPANALQVGDLLGMSHPTQLYGDYFINHDFQDFIFGITLPETNNKFAPENRASEKDISSEPNINFQVRAVSFREGILLPPWHLAGLVSPIFPPWW